MIQICLCFIDIQLHECGVQNLNLKFAFEVKLAFVANYVQINFIPYTINK